MNQNQVTDVDFVDLPKTVSAVDMRDNAGRATNPNFLHSTLSEELKGEGDVDVPNVENTDVPVMKDGKLRATSQTQQDQLADFMAVIHAPVPEEHKPEGLEPEPLPDVGTRMEAFMIPEGDDLALLVLHPVVKDGVRQNPAQLVITMNNSDWSTWVKQALCSGLTVGKVLSSTNKELTGFTCVLRDPMNQRHPMGFLFSQVASVVPFRDIEGRLTKVAGDKDNEKRNKLRLSKIKSLKKQAAKSRKRNKN